MKQSYSCQLRSNSSQRIRPANEHSNKQKHTHSKSISNHPSQQLKTARFTNNKNIHPVNKLEQQNLNITQTIQMTRYQTKQKQQKRSTNSKNKNNSKLVSIPIIQNSIALTQINYSNNKISLIPKQFCKFYQNLQKIDLSNNEIIQISALCNLKKLVVLNVSHNSINHIPKQIKNLINLQVLDISYNKLWYVNQIISLKQLIESKHSQIKQAIKINLDSNPVLKTNQKTIEKFINIKFRALQNKMQNFSNQYKKGRQRTAFNNQIQQNKQNIHPNQAQHIKLQSNATNTLRNQINSLYGNKQQNLISKKQQNIKTKNSFKNIKVPFQQEKINKSRSFNQSLLDISAIITTNVVTSAQNNQNVPLKNQQNHEQKLKNSKKAQKQLNNLIQKKIYQNVQSQQPTQNIIHQKLHHIFTPDKTQTLLFDSPSQKDLFQNKENSSDSIHKISHQSLNHRILSYFKKVDNFESLYLNQSNNLKQFFIQMEKKLKLAENLKQIPDFFKNQVKMANQHLLIKIQLALDLLRPFDNFFEKDYQINQTFKIIQKKYTRLSSLEKNSTGELSFHQKIVEKFLNHQNIDNIRWYEILMTLSRKVQQKIPKLLSLINSLIILYKKIHKICTFFNFSKQNKTKLAQKTQFKQEMIGQKHFTQKKNTYKKQLNFLLFSDHKSCKDSQNISSKKENYSKSKSKLKFNEVQNLQNYEQKGNQNFCMQCALKDQQITELNKKMLEQEVKCKKLQNNIESLIKELKNFEQKLIYDQKLLGQQQQIIIQLQSLKPSLYQNVLLQQALTIQGFLQNSFLNVCKISYDAKNTTNIAQQRLQTKCKNGNLRQKQQDSDFLINKGSNNSNVAQIQKNIEFNSQKQRVKIKYHTQQSQTKQKSQRTYFKSNKIASLTNCNTIQLKQSQESQKQTKQQCQFKESWPKKNHVISVSMFNENNNLDKDKETNGLYQISNQNNNMFQKIEMRNSMKQKTLYNNQLLVDYYNLQKADKLQILKKLNYIRNFYNGRIPQNQQINTFSSIDRALSLKNKPHKSSSQKMNMDMNFLHQKQYMAKGYDYQNLSLEEKKNYKEYIKFYLRNSIKQTLLLRKQQIKRKNQKGGSLSQGKNKSYKKGFQQQLKWDSTNNLYQKKIQNSGKVLLNVLNLQKNSKVKFIDKKWDTDRK